MTRAPRPAARTAVALGSALLTGCSNHAATGSCWACYSRRRGADRASPGDGEALRDELGLPPPDTD